MGDLARHFFSREFACPCCDRSEMNPVLIACLEWLRVLVDKPVIITSGYRCPDHNERIGGHPQSYHLQGKAADLKIPPMNPEQIFEVARRLFPILKNFGIYSTWIHIDIGSRAGKQPNVWRKS